MSRSRYFVGLAAAVLLVGTASLAQAQQCITGMLPDRPLVRRG